LCRASAELCAELRAEPLYTKLPCAKPDVELYIEPPTNI